jgi:hypothetical protein
VLYSLWIQSKAFSRILIGEGMDKVSTLDGDENGLYGDGDTAIGDGWDVDKQVGIEGDDFGTLSLCRSLMPASWVKRCML